MSTNSTKTIKGRISNKHGTEEYWILSVYTDVSKNTLRDNPFIPLDGELIIYDPDELCAYKRFKFGDGVNHVVALPFVEQQDWDALQSLSQSVSTNTANILGLQTEAGKTRYWADQQVSLSSNNNSAPTFSPNFKVNVQSNTGYAGIINSGWSSPISKYLWHDLLAFGMNGHPSVKYSVDNGTSWLEYTDSDIENFRKLPFIQKEDQIITVLNNKHPAIRWEWQNSGFHVCRGSYLNIGFAYSQYQARFDIILELSKDNGATWSTLINMKNQNYNSSPYWFYISDNWASVTNARLSFVRVGTGSDPTKEYTSCISCIRILSERWGNQGRGSEYEFPYNWNYNQDIFPKANNSSALGTASNKWSKVYATQFVGKADEAAYADRADGANKLLTKTTVDGKETYSNLTKGSATQPIYIKNGVPETTTYTLEKSVPSNANFDNTAHTHAAGDGLVLVDNKTGGTTGEEVSYKVALKSYTKNTNESGKEKFYPVQLDSNGVLAVQVDWENLTVSEAPKDEPDEGYQYVVTKLSNNGHAITADYASIPTYETIKAFVQGEVSGAVEYMGTVSSAEELGKNDKGEAVSVGKGDFYKAQVTFTMGNGGETVDVGDVIIASIDNPQNLGDWDVLHTSTDADTLAGQLPAYYLNFNNFTNTQDVVIGPGKDKSTDNAIVRFDGTNGAKIQNSSATIDDNGYITTPRLLVQANGNTITIGSQNASFAHIYNSASIPFIFNNAITVTNKHDLGTSAYPWGDLYLSGKIYGDNYNYTLPSATGTLALTTNIKDGILTLEAGSGLLGDKKTFGANSDSPITFSVQHGDTSSVTDLQAANRRYVSALTFDDFGHVTGYETGTETVTDTKNTVGTVLETSKALYMVGVDAIDGQNTYRISNVNNKIYATGGALTTTSVKIGDGKVSMEYDSTNECVNFIFN